MVIESGKKESGSCATNHGGEKYYITFLDTDIEINFWRLEFGKKEERQKEIENIYKISQFYMQLNE